MDPAGNPRVAQQITVQDLRFQLGGTLKSLPTKNLGRIRENGNTPNSKLFAF